MIAEEKQEIVVILLYHCWSHIAILSQCNVFVTLPPLLVLHSHCNDVTMQYSCDIATTAGPTLHCNDVTMQYYADLQAIRGYGLTRVAILLVIACHLNCYLGLSTVHSDCPDFFKSINGMISFIRGWKI